MTAGLAEFEARLADIEAQLEFVVSAARLRPRLNGVVRWEAQGEETELAAAFMGQKGARPEGLFAGLLLRSLAAFERYVRRCVSEAIRRQAAEAVKYEDLSEHLRERNIVLTGKLLARLDSPAEHIEFNVDSLIDGLASCRSGVTSFSLNAVGFEAVVTGASPAAIERALKMVGHRDWWDKIGSVPGIDVLLSCDGRSKRDVGKRGRERLHELWKWRNGIAHGGDAEIAFSEEEIRQHIRFLRLVGQGLDALISG